MKFLLEDDRDRRGHGGRTFTLRTEVGPVPVKGPWSSRAGVANLVAPMASIEVVAHHEGRAYTGLNLGIATAFLALARHQKDWTLVPDPDNDGELAWALRWHPSEALREGRTTEETHQDFLDWKRTMNGMVWAARRWVV